MVIDEDVEAKVRAIFNAVVKRNDDELEAALGELSSDGLRAKALELATAIGGVVAFDTFKGRPSADAIREVSAELAGMEKWSTLTSGDVESILSSIVERQVAVGTLDEESAFIGTFIVTGSLLAASPRIGEGEWWFNYLDRVEMAIENAAESS